MIKEVIVQLCSIFLYIKQPNCMLCSAIGSYYIVMMKELGRPEFLNTEENDDFSYEDACIVILDYKLNFEWTEISIYWLCSTIFSGSMLGLINNVLNWVGSK